MTLEVMEKAAADAYNATFIAAMDHEEKRAQVEDRMLTYIKRRIRETGFTRHILYQMPVTKDQLQRDIDHDTVYYVGDIEPDSAAMELNFRGEPRGVYVNAKRYFVPFNDISTQRMSKRVSELHAYRMPLIDVITKNQVKDIEEAEDRKFINLCHSAIATSGQAINDAALDTITKQFIAKVTSLIDGQELDCRLYLMNKVSMNDFLSQDTTQFGDDLTSKVTQDGWTLDNFFGRKLIVTVKVNIVQNNEMFAFVSQEYLGHFLMLGSLAFYLRKLFGLLQWQSEETVGMNIANIRGIARGRWSTGTTKATVIAPRETNP